MTLFLNSNLFMITLISGLIALISESVQNSTDDLGKVIKGKNILNIFAMIIFIISFIIFIISISVSDGVGIKTILVILSSLGVMLSKFLGKSGMDILNFTSMDTKEKIYTSIYIISWIILGVSTGYKRGQLGLILGLIVSGLIIVSKTIFLPFQNENKVVELPGLSIYSFALFIMSILNAMIDPSMLGIASVQA